MSFFLAAYWIVWTILAAYVARMCVRQQRLARQVAAMTDVLQRSGQRQSRDSRRTDAA